MATPTIETASRVAHGPWVDRAARLGFVARGVVYIIIGMLAVKIAMGEPKQESADKQGALALIAGQPFGEGILVVLAIGLGGYALWRFGEALWGHAQESDTKKRRAKQLTSAGKGAVYGVFCFTAISFVANSSKAERSGSNGSQSEHSWTATVLGWPGGRRRRALCVLAWCHAEV